MSVKRVARRRLPKPGPMLDRDTIEVLDLVHHFLRKHRARGYVVGGFLRDMFLGTPSKDLDIVVSGVEPKRVALEIHKCLDYSRPVVFPRFKTALTVGKTLRIEVCPMERSRGEDAVRRDFTVNCLYAGLGTLLKRGAARKVLDPTGRGLEDLRLGILRTPDSPCRTMWRDPLRILRALRLAAVRGLRLDPALRECIPRVVYLMSRVAAERIRVELEMILLSGRVVSSFGALQSLGVCEIIMPELSHAYGFDQSTPYHAYDLFTHTLKTTANTPADLTLRLAALLHDLGKPATRGVKSGRATYYGHQETSGRLAEAVLRRLRFPRRIRDRVLFLVRNHMIHYSESWSDKAVRRFVRKMGPDLDDMLLLAEADQKAQVPGRGRDLPARGLRRRIQALRETDGIHLGLPINGHEIMSVLGLDEGPQVGMAKNRLLEEASGRSKPMSRQDAIEVLKKWAKSQGLR